MTLGFGFKSYLAYRLRVRRQRDVRKENEFYQQLLQQALPPGQQRRGDGTEETDGKGNFLGVLGKAGVLLMLVMLKPLGKLLSFIYAALHGFALT